jgi:predicted HTH transcriptional regulator
MTGSFKGNRSESLPIDTNQIKWLSELVKEGEGLYLEFKLRATYPDKIVHEIVAFANTRGGKLLIGVDDDGRLAGVKYPEEESLVVMRALIKHARPRIHVKYFYVRLTAKRWVVVFEVPESNRKPIKFMEGRNKLLYFIRFDDKSLQASREAEGILKLQSAKATVSFTYGDIENKILKTIERKSPITLVELSLATQIPEAKLSSHIIKLAATRVVGWRPQEPRDIFFSLSPNI